MPGERFSQLYARPGEFSPDSARARYRVGMLFRETALTGHIESMAGYLSRNLGIAPPGDGKHPSCWHQFVRECRVADFLDTITVIYRFCFWHVGDHTASWWREAARKIFAEEHLAYEIDDAGGVHTRVDQEFQRNNFSAIEGLQSERYRAIRELLERASGHLNAEPPNYRQAWRATWSALDALFQLMFPSAQLTAGEIESRLRPLLTHIYENDAPSQRAAFGLLRGFQQWIEAAASFHHQPGKPECSQPAADVAVLSISCASALLRWLAGIDEHLRASNWHSVRRDQ
jgi:hypothetical protein